MRDVSVLEIKEGDEPFSVCSGPDSVGGFTHGEGGVLLLLGGPKLSGLLASIVGVGSFTGPVSSDMEKEAPVHLLRFAIGKRETCAASEGAPPA